MHSGRHSLSFSDLFLINNPDSVKRVLPGPSLAVSGGFLRSHNNNSNYNSTNSNVQQTTTHSTDIMGTLPIYILRNHLATSPGQPCTDISLGTTRE